MAKPSRKRVLVVDDNPETVEVMVQILRLHGHQVKGMPDAKDIVASVRDYDPDAIVMDITMPGKSGWDAAKELRAALPHSALLIALTGEKDTGDNVIGGPEGFDYFLTKPCDINVLTALVGQS